MNIQHGTDIGRYHILEQLGEGGMAIVYKAYDTRSETEVAVKIIRTDNIVPIALEKARKRFEIETRKMLKLRHPNIVPVIDFGEYEGIPYLVMPYIPGGTLKQRLGKPIPWQEAVRIILPIADALSYAHKSGLVHRDVKPSNILIDENDQPLLTDFGIAKVLEGDETLDFTLTTMGIGTPEYMAPEQAEGKTVDFRADIYSLGIVLYEMITGRKPYIADTPMAVLIKQIRDPLPNLSEYVNDVPKQIERILFKSLAKKPEYRFLALQDFQDELVRLLNYKTFLDNPDVQIDNIQTEKLIKNQQNSHQAITSFFSRKWIGIILFAAILIGGFFLLQVFQSTNIFDENLAEIDRPIDSEFEEELSVIIHTPSAETTPAPQFKKWKLTSFDDNTSNDLIRVNYFSEANLIFRSNFLGKTINLETIDPNNMQKLSECSIELPYENIENLEWEINDVSSNEDLIIIRFWQIYAVGIYNFRTCEEIMLLGPHEGFFADSSQGYINDAKFTQYDDIIALIPNTGLVIIFNYANLEVITNFKYHLKPVERIVFSSKENIVASIGLGDHTIFLWDIFDRENRIEFKNCKDILSFSPNGKYFAYVTVNNSVKIFDTEIGKDIFEYQNDIEINDISFSRDNKILAFSDQGFHLRLFEISSGNIINNIETDYTIADVLFINDNELLLVSGFEEVNCRTSRPVTDPLSFWCDKSWFQKIAIYNIDKNSFDAEFNWPEGIVNGGYYFGPIKSFLSIINDSDMALIEFENNVYLVLKE